MADIILAMIKREPNASDDDILQKTAAKQDPECNASLQSVWNKLSMYPHMFEVALARGRLDSLGLDGHTIATTSMHKRISQISFSGWTVNMDYFENFAKAVKLHPSLQELFALAIRPQLPDNVFLHKAYKSRRKEFLLSKLSETKRMCWDFFPFWSPVGYFTIFAVCQKREGNGSDTSHLIQLTQADYVFDEHTLGVQQHLKDMVGHQHFEKFALPLTIKSDFVLLAAVAWLSKDELLDKQHEALLNAQSKARKWSLDAVQAAHHLQEESLSKIWTVNDALRNEFYGIFSPPLAGSPKSFVTSGRSPSSVCSRSMEFSDFIGAGTQSGQERPRKLHKTHTFVTPAKRPTSCSLKANTQTEQSDKLESQSSAGQSPPSHPIPVRPMLKRAHITPESTCGPPKRTDTSSTTTHHQATGQQTKRKRQTVSTPLDSTTINDLLVSRSSPQPLFKRWPLMLY